METCKGCNIVPNLECLVGQLVESVKSLQQDVKDVDRKIETIEQDIKSFNALKNKGIGIAFTIACLFSAIGWVANNYATISTRPDYTRSETKITK